MIYLAKLSSRLSRIRIGQAAMLALSLSCATGEKKDFLAPDPNLIVPVLATLQVAPKAATLRAGSEVQFSATGISTSGASMAASVEWMADGGTISADGRFTASASGRYRVWAQVKGKPQIADSSQVGVWVLPTDVLDVVVYPDSVEAGENEGIQFVAHAKLANGSTSSSVPLYWTTSAGYVDGSGWYVPTTVGTHEVLALSVNGVRGSGKIIVKKSKRTLVSLTVSPDGSTVSAGNSLTFTAAATWSDGSTGAPSVIWSSTGGTIDGNGTFLAGAQAGTWQVVARQSNGVLADTAKVTVSPATVTGLVLTPTSSTLAPGAAQRFTASAKLSDGSTSSAVVAWQATGGSMTSAGDYTAGPIAGSYKVKAVLNGTSISSEAPVSIAASTATLTQLILNPSSVTLATGGAQQMAVTGLYSDGTTGVPPVSWAATGGSISSGGLYTAGSATGSFRIIATAGGKADTTGVTISGPPLSQLTLSPGSVTLQSGHPVQFSAAGTWSDGTSGVPSVTYSATGGSITAGGLYTAGSANGTFRVIAAATQGTLRDTSFVTISVASPTLTGLVLSPSSVAVSPSGGYQFNVSGTWSNGTTNPPAVTYSTTGGTVSSTGLYVAGSNPGTYQVIAKATSGTLADTSAVTVALTAPTLTGLVVTPGSASVQAGGSRQFVAGGTWSDGSATAPTVTWSATGGSISSAGLYIAGSSAGTHRVIAKHFNGTRADTAEVTVTAPLSLTSLKITPESVTLNTGGTQQLSVLGTYSNGSTGVPAVTYSATGGTVSANGLYTAGLLAGSFLVVASCECGQVDTAFVAVAAAAPSGLPAAPGAPQFTLGTQGSTTSSVSVTWSAGSGATSYRYSAGQSVSGGAWTQNGNTDSPGVTLAAAPNGTSIFVCVWSRNASGESTTNSCKGYTVPASVQEPPPQEPPPSGPNGMFFNSAEAGCGTDASILLCDDFEDGDWYSKNCDQANGSGGLLQTDGWCGTIYASISPAGAAKCGGQGAKGTNCAAVHAGGGTKTMADHALSQGVSEVWVRYYTKPESGYLFGAEKMLTFNDGNPGDAGIRWGNLSFNCAAGGTSPSGNFIMGFPVPQDQCLGTNVSGISVQSGRWYYVEAHMKLSTPGLADGVFELWVNDCGTSGVCSGSPTLRTRTTTVRHGRTLTSQLIRTLWWESWSNPASVGTRLIDQIKVSKAGQVGF